MIELTIPGKPCAKQRARVTRYGTWTPKQTVDYEMLIRQRFADEYPDHVPYDGPVELIVRAYFPVAKSASKVKRQLMLDGDTSHIIKPDWDNIGKIFSDALNQIAYVDDSQIVRGMVFKTYSDQPRVIVTVEPLTTG